MENAPEKPTVEKEPSIITQRWLAILEQNVQPLLAMMQSAAAENAKADRWKTTGLLLIVGIIAAVACAAIFTGHEDIAEKILIAILAFLGGFSSSKAVK